MKQSQLTITEFERIYQHSIGKKDFDDIENFILKNSKNTSFLSIGSGSGGKFIQARNYVGVLQTKSGLTIEILPKIADKNDDDKANKLKDAFLKMLKSLKNFLPRSSNLANLKTQNLPLLEIFISMFLCVL